MKLLRKRWVRFSFVIVAFATITAISSLRLYSFPGESMSPTIKAGDQFIGAVGLWGIIRSPRRFDLVIFNVPPSSHFAGQGIPWMKRLVGLPGEQIRLSGDELFIDGKKIDAPFLHADTQTSPPKQFETTLGADQYFVLGDNLDHSFEDSRAIGPIDRSLIKGCVAFVWRK